ncbi:MAG: orotidine 5'-phosphate decarboxylase / HUMPS family protein, partial [Asticcacaulis sp.]
MSDPRLIIALDEPDLKSARELVEKLGDHVSFYKIGLTLLGQGGLELARDLSARGKQVFQDWKLHD